MKNREVYQRDPKEFILLNNGVAKVGDAHSSEELQTLQFELRTFICEGQYEKGLIRLLQSYLTSLGKPEQPAAWVSGFFGSGKSHLVKMLRYLWVDYEFPDGTTARGLARLSPPVEDLLKELSTAAKRHGGRLHAASGTLGAGKAGSIRLALLSIIFKSAGLPEKYPLAQFVLWLKRENLYEQLKQRVEDGGKSWDKELNNLTKSSIPVHLHDLKPSFGNSVADVRQILKAEHHSVDDISVDDMVEAIKDALTVEGEFPLTLVVLDEVQQYIHEEASRSIQVQEITQACCAGLGARLLFVATGQNALTGDHYLSKLAGRYRVKVQLSDADVEKVTRKTVLQKKASARPTLKQLLERNSGEISRHLTGTEFAPKPEDQEILVDDYPLLPTRRRFWERVLRAVDEAGTQSQVRSQLITVDEAVKQNADAPVGTLVGGDFLYFDKKSDLLQSEQLTSEIDTRIERLRENDPLGASLCALAFLIGKLPQERGGDTGLRATAENFADLLVKDIEAGSSQLRKDIAEKLDELEGSGILMKVEGEYRLQTRESQEWLGDFQRYLTEIKKKRGRLATLRQKALQKTTEERLKEITTIKHGDSNESRRVELYFTSEKPSPGEGEVPLWIRDGWRDTEASVQAEARQAGHESPMLFIFLPKRRADTLDNAIAKHEAAQRTLELRGQTTTPEGIEAQRAMQTRRDQSLQQKKDALGDVLDDARVYLAGGQEYEAETLVNAIRQAATNALERLFDKFSMADDSRWTRVVRQALDGDATALKVLEYRGKVHEHPVCAEVLKQLRASTKGAAVRKHFAAPPYGWPQDAVDASLALLTVTDNVVAQVNGQTVDVGDLNQRTLSSANFRAESVTITHRQRIELRGLFDSLGVSGDDEASKAPAFLAMMQSIAKEASGRPPLPETPDLSYVRELERYSGNQQLSEIHARIEQINEDLHRWQSWKNRSSERQRHWEVLNKALTHAEGLEGAQAIEQERDAIKEQRSLLRPDDPTQPLIARAEDLLRNALQEARDAYQRALEQVHQQLEENETWQALSMEDREAILSRYNLEGVPPIEVGTTEQLLQSLDAISLDEWKTRQDALQHRFNQALNDAAKKLEPKTTHVRVTSAVLKTEDEVDAWLTDTRQKLLDKLADGPVRV